MPRSPIEGDALRADELLRGCSIRLLENTRSTAGSEGHGPRGGAEMRRYFPHVEIVWQRIAGAPKSMTAIKHCNLNDGTARRG